VRRQIIAVALGEVGKVNDLGGDDGLKKGWQRLKQYYDEASEWGPDCSQKAGVLYQIQQPWQRPTDWCGIFGTWCFRQAGVSASWKFGVGPGLLPCWDPQNIAPGDMGVIADHIHHFIVVKRDGNRIWTVSGNSTNDGITQDSPRSVSDVRYYYRPSADVWVETRKPDSDRPELRAVSDSLPASAEVGLAGALGTTVAAEAASATSDATAAAGSAGSTDTGSSDPAASSPPAPASGSSGDSP
jgi:hypothetical protein